MNNLFVPDEVQMNNQEIIFGEMNNFEAFTGDGVQNDHVDDIADICNIDNVRDNTDNMDKNNGVKSSGCNNDYDGDNTNDNADYAIDDYMIIDDFDGSNNDNDQIVTDDDNDFVCLFCSFETQGSTNLGAHIAQNHRNLFFRQFAKKFKAETGKK